MSSHWQGNRIGHAFRGHEGEVISCPECLGDLHAWRAEPGGEDGRGPICGEPGSEGPCLMANGHWFGKHAHRRSWPAHPLLHLGAPAKRRDTGEPVRIVGVDFSTRLVMARPDYEAFIASKNTSAPLTPAHAADEEDWEWEPLADFEHTP